MIIQMLRIFQKELPMEVGGSDWVITQVELIGDTITYTCSVACESLLPAEYLQSESFLARVVSSIGEDNVKTLVEKCVGIKYMYVSNETGELMYEVCISPKRLRDLYEKVTSGQIEPLTFIDLIQLEFEGLELPVAYDEVIWTKAYVRQGNVYYEYEFSEVDADDYDDDVFDELIAEQKGEIVVAMRSEAAIQSNRKEIIDMNTHFIYVYTDHRGTVLYTIDVSPYDVFYSR